MPTLRLLLVALLSLMTPAVAQDAGLVGEPVLRRDRRYRGVLQSDGATPPRITLVGTEGSSILRVPADRVGARLKSLVGWWVEITANQSGGRLDPTELLSPLPEFVRGWVSRSAQGYSLRDASSPDAPQLLSDPGGVLEYALRGAAGPRSLDLRVLRLSRDSGSTSDVRVMAAKARITEPTKLFADVPSVFGLLWARGTGELGDPLENTAWVTRVETHDAAKGHVAAFVRRETQVSTLARDPWDGEQRSRWAERITSGYLDASRLEFGDEVATVEGVLETTPSQMSGMLYNSEGVYRLEFPEDVSLVGSNGEVFGVHGWDYPRMTELGNARGRRVRITAVRRGTQLQLGTLSSLSFLDLEQARSEPQQGLVDRVP